jgi:FecR protein
MRGRHMFYGRACALWTLIAVSLLTLPANSQSVISTRSGVVHFFEGAVYLGNQPLERHPGKFESIPQGGELRTEQGRAEVLLTPGVIIRMGERSTIRMVANELSNTRVELLRGSVIVDSSEPNSGKAVKLIYKSWNIGFIDQGSYRIDFAPPRLWVLQGKAKVTADNNKDAPPVGQGMDLPFASVLVPERSTDPPRDALSNWAEGRQQSISADNAIAANIQDPASMNTANADADAFTYYPMLALPSLGPGLSDPYSSSLLYQPGFNSIYLPGYSYMPVFVGLAAGGFSTPLRVSPNAGGLPMRIPRGPVVPSMSVVPLSPHPIPVRPVPVHPAPTHTIGVHAGGVHGGVHR